MNNRFHSSSTLADLLSKGSPAIFPTDTLPALAASPEFSRQIFKLKKRTLAKPLILMGSCLEDVFQASSASAKDDALLMAEKYWPGPLTMVLPASGSLVDSLNPGGQTIGIRVPNCSMTKKLLSKSGPLATTSANMSGQNPIFLIEELMECFPKVPFLAPMNWPESSGLASTVIAWKGIGHWQLLRRGAVMPKECETLLEK